MWLIVIVLIEIASLHLKASLKLSFDKTKIS